MHRHSKHTPHTLQTHKNAHTLQTHKHAHTPNTQKRTQPPKSQVSPERKVAQGRGWYHWKGRTRIMGDATWFQVSTTFLSKVIHERHVCPGGQTPFYPHTLTLTLNNKKIKKKKKKLKKKKT